jgi:hypothetical protein
VWDAGQRAASSQDKSQSGSDFTHLQLTARAAKVFDGGTDGLLQLNDGTPVIEDLACVMGRG